MEKLEYPIMNMPPELMREALKNWNVEPPKPDEPVRPYLAENVPPAIKTAPIHTHRVFDMNEFPKIVAWVISVVKKERYEALAGTGHSGLLVIGAVCHALRIPMIAVRKEGDPARGDSAQINAILPHHDMRYAFVDDLVCSGKTLRRVISQVEDRAPALLLAGIILYAGDYVRESLLTDLGISNIPIHKFATTSAI